MRRRILIIEQVVQFMSDCEMLTSPGRITVDQYKLFSTFGAATDSIGIFRQRSVHCRDIKLTKQGLRINRLILAQSYLRTKLASKRFSFKNGQFFHFDNIVSIISEFFTTRLNAAICSISAGDRLSTRKAVASISSMTLSFSSYSIYASHPYKSASFSIHERGNSLSPDS